MPPTHFAFHPIPLGPPRKRRGKLLWLLERNEPEAHFRWAMRVPDTLVVFVHGFNSGALRAWHDFDKLLVGDPLFAKSDICFFQYDGVRRQVLLSAAVLRSFLLDTLSNATSLANSDDFYRRREETSYKRVLVVAHSTGAIVVRQALADIAGDASGLSSFSSAHCAMLMFAPAYCGAKLSEFVKQIVTGGSFSVAQLASRAMVLNAQVVSDLDPESVTLVRLREKVLSLLHRGMRSDLLTPARVTVGLDDNVIIAPNTYPDDPPINALPGFDHVSVCKPQTTSDRRYKELTIIANIGASLA